MDQFAAETALTEPQPKDQWAVFATSTGATLFHPIYGQYSVASTHPKWETIKKALRHREFALAVDMIEAHLKAARALQTYSTQVRVDPVTGLATVPSGYTLSDEVAEKIHEMVDSGHPTAPLDRFLTKLMENPAQHTWKEALLFIDANGFSLFEDGDVLGYKGVREDYLDIYTGTINNTPGAVITMERPKVDDDRRVACSSGLHVATHGYARRYAGGGRVVIVKVKPQDIVSVPHDHSNEKMRTCGYTVVAELKNRDTPLDSDTQVYRLGDLAF